MLKRVVKIGDGLDPQYPHVREAVATFENAARELENVLRGAVLKRDDAQVVGSQMRDMGKVLRKDESGEMVRCYETIYTVHVSTPVEMQKDPVDAPPADVPSP